MSRHDTTRGGDPRLLIAAIYDQSRLCRSIDEVPDALKRITDAGVRVWCHLSDAEVKRKTAVALGLLERFVSGYGRLRHGGALAMEHEPAWRLGRVSVR